MRMAYKKPLSELLNYLVRKGNYLVRKGIDISNLKIVDENDNGGVKYGN